MIWNLGKVTPYGECYPPRFVSPNCIKSYEGSQISIDSIESVLFFLYIHKSYFLCYNIYARKC